MFEYAEALKALGAGDSCIERERERERETETERASHKSSEPFLAPTVASMKLELQIPNPEEATGSCSWPQGHLGRVWSRSGRLGFVYQGSLFPCNSNYLQFNLAVITPE